MTALPAEFLCREVLTNILWHLQHPTVYPLSNDAAVLWDYLLETHGPDFTLPVLDPYVLPAPTTCTQKMQRWCVHDSLWLVQDTHPYPLPDTEKQCVWAAQDWLQNPTEINRKRALLKGNAVLNSRTSASTIPADIAFTAGMFPCSDCTVAYPNVADNLIGNRRHTGGHVKPIVALLSLLTDVLPDL